MAEIIYDCNNWLRRRCERGSSLRTCFAEVMGRPGTLVFDGPGGLKRRRALYPEYKAGRKSLSSDITAQFELFMKLAQYLPVSMIRIPGWEADDVIATLTTFTKEMVEIMSTDADFLQLPNVRLPERDRPFPVESRYVRLYKALVGDKSDNIPGVKGFGLKAWEHLADSERDVLQTLLSGETNLIPHTLPVGTFNWLGENLDKARMYYHITNLFTVPMEEILGHVSTGTFDIGAADALFMEYHL